MRSLIQREKVGSGERGGLAIKGTRTSVWQMCGDAEREVTECCDRIPGVLNPDSRLFSGLVELGLIPELVKDDESLS